MVLQNHTQIVDTKSVNIPTENNNSDAFYKNNRNIIKMMQNLAYFT